MRRFFIPGIAFMIYLLYSQTYGQTQETEKPFQYQRWQYLHQAKCSKCHTLERVFADPKTDDEWRICVMRMMMKSPLWITPEEGRQIVDEILGTRKGVIVPIPKKKKYKYAQLLFIDRCTNCHPVSRILEKNKTKEEWEETVLRMRDNDPDLFLEEDIPILIDYLTERGKIMREDITAKAIVAKCIICHEPGRILLERKSRRDWKKCVTIIRKLARQTMKKDWFTHHEFKIIVDLLVKTQELAEEEG
ncbi:MAG: hypothetical protein ACE5GU_02100 [Candidatus Scalinduaceae bacterium]